MRGTLVFSLGLVSLALVGNSFAAEPLLRFQHIAPEDSYAPRAIVDVAEDPEGFLWFASLYGGFARFDGMEFRSYRADPTRTDGPPSNSVSCVYPDPERRVVWVCSTDGLIELALDTEEIRVHRHDPADPGSLAHPGVYRVLRDSRGTLWVGTEGGLSRWDDAARAFSHYPLAEEATDVNVVTPPSWVWELYEDRTGVLWVGTIGGGLHRYDSAEDSFRRFVHDPEDPASLPFDGVRAIFEDTSGRLWIGTDRGLAVMTERIGGRFERRTDHTVTNIREDLSGNLWVAHRAGLALLHSGSDALVEITHDPAQPTGLGPGMIWRMHVDRDGRLWTPGDQISWLSPSGLAFSLFRKNEPLGNYEPDLTVDNRGQAWVAERDGLWQLDLDTENWSHHVPFPDTEFPDHNWVRGAGTLVTPEATYWVATAGHINRFDPGNGSFESWELPVGANAMTETRDGELWLGLPFQGLARFETTQGEMELFSHDPENDRTLSNDFPYLVLEGPEGELWVGTHRGLNRFDRSTAEVQRYFAEPGNATSLSNSSVRYGLLDRQGRLWFGTELGLNRYDTGTDTFQRYFNGDSPGHNVIHKILEDDDGTFWIGMDGGLAHFDPQTGEFQNLTHVDGVPAGFEPDLNWGPDGAIYALAPAGVVRIDPAKLRLTSSDPVLAWTGYSTTSKGEGTLDWLRPPEALSLTHRNELITLGFTALDYSNPEGAGFRYRLAGFTDDWVPIDGGARQLTLSPLPPGDYTLELQALGANGTPQASALSLPISYHPPPWLSPGAYLAYVLLGLTAIWLFVNWRTRLLKVRASDLAVAVEDRTQRLKKSEQTVRLQSEELRELLDTKERLFANVSHEFRTPLTLMLGPIEHARAATENIEIQRQLDMARRNGNRVLRLVDQLLALSRLAAEEPVVRSPNPVGDVIETVTDAFRPLANDQGIALSMTLDRNLWSELPPEALERVLMNLLSNALKFTREGGHVAVEAGALGDEQWQLKVTDTGTGIAPGERQRVFERFERARGKGRGVPGSGLGLALVKELVEAYDGEIGLDSEVGEGTTVTITLPRHIPREGLTIKRDGAPSDALVREVELLRHADSEESTDEAAGIDRPQVLVVEDNADMRAYIRQILSADHQVLLASDGDEGLALAQEQVPDLVLSDVMMPGLSGIELAGKIRQNMSTSHIPIVLLTARSDDASRLEGLREQVDDYLVKPFNAEELRLRVTNLLAIREILRARYGNDLSAGKDPGTSLSAPERKFLDRLSGVLETHHGQQGFGVHEFAAEMAMSERQLQRKLKAVTGQSPGQYLRLFRLERSLPLLRDGMPVGQVALTVGFTSPAHFSSCFRAQYGCTPTEYEQKPSSLAT